MFVDFETICGEKLTINTDFIISFSAVRRDKVCILLVNDLDYTLDCGYEKMRSLLNADSGVSCAEK